MMVSDEEKRWLVVGIAMNKVAAPVLRDFIKQGMDTHYANNTYCHGLTTPYTLNTLTYHHANADPNLRRLKFQNVNSNLNNHGNHKKLYNYSINSSVDLAKLFLPDYLAEFSGFDESLDISAILRLLGCNKPAPIFHSPNPLLSIQSSADDVRENVRNKWGHCNVSDWTEVFSNDCFSKLETLVRSLGLTGGIEKMTLDQLSDWETKGCQLCMGHAVDHNLLSLVQQDVKELIKNYKTTEESLAQQRTEQTAMQNTVCSIQDQQSATRARLEEHDEQLAAVLEWKEQQMEENKEILVTLVSVEKMLSEELLIRVEGVEKGLAETDHKVEQLEQGFAKTDDKVEQLKQGIAKTDDKVEQLEQGIAKTDDKVEQLEQGIAKTDDKVEQLEREFAKVEKDVSETGNKVKQLEEAVRSQKMKENTPEASTVETFDVKSCRSKLAEHYKRTATVPTSVWSKSSLVDIHQIYTRLSWVKEEQTPAGSSQSELNHYTDLFTANKNRVVPKRILVQGQTGIGKSTFVKKLAVDWAELCDQKTRDKQKDALRRLEDEKDMNEKNKETLTSQDDNNTSSEGDADESREAYEDTSSDDYEDMYETMRKFELVLVINLKEVSKCPSLKDVICRCNIFPDEEAAMAEDLLSYITKNQEKVLLVFDGYDEYRCGSDSEIYEIFKGKKLRNCCVLITTRISKADELREFKDMHVEITGFSEEDRKAFMSRMLGVTDTINLLNELFFRGLQSLGRVPLLLLFFCTLWKKGKLKSLPENKTKLYLEIVQYVLDYSQGKHSPSRFGKVQDFKEILSEIGKVALECLLKDDHVFEYDQLSAAILCEESVIIGLLQVTEYAENLRPAGMVSFIHKSIQEFLAAWFITHRCVPEGNLGGIEEYACTLEDCEALENVFLFVCGLSDNGTVKVLQHLTSVRIPDPTLDLSKTIPDVENETDGPLCDVTDRHKRFSNLVYNSFEEVHSKAELLGHCFECTGGIVLVNGQVMKVLQRAKQKDLIQVTHSGVFFSIQKLYDFFLVKNYSETVSTLNELIEFLDCLHIPLRITENSEVLTVGDFVKKFQNLSECHRCIFNSILCFRNGQFQFYITDLELCCDGHTRLFTEPTKICVPSLSVNLCSKQSCLKFLRSLQCLPGQSDETRRALGAAIRNCKNLNRIEVGNCDDSVCDLLEQVPNPRVCSLKIEIPFFGFPLWKVHLTSAGAVKLASLLPRFSNIIALDLGLRDCCVTAVETLVLSITHKTLLSLRLNGISLTPAAAAAFGRSLPEMSSLAVLFVGVDRSILQPSEMKALFDGFAKTLPLKVLTFSCFRVMCLAPLTKCLRFFPSLKQLYLRCVDEYHLLGLLQSLKFIPNLEILSVQGKPVGCADCCKAKENTVAFTLKVLKELRLDEISLTPAVAATLGRLLPEMLSIEKVLLTGLTGSIVKPEEMEALFGGFNRTLPLEELRFNSFSVNGILAPLAKSLRFFPKLRELEFGEFNMDERDLCGLLKNFRFVPNLTTLSVHGKPLGQTGCCTAAVNALVAGITHKTLEDLALDGINLTPAAAALLGRSLPKMTFLHQLYLKGLDGSVLQGEEVEALFGGFNKTLPLHRLTFSGFSVRGCLAPLIKSLHFFPNLRELYLYELNMDEQDLHALLESFRFITSCLTVSLSGSPLRHALTFTICYYSFVTMVSFHSRVDCSEEDLSYLQKAFKQVLPQVHFESRY